MKILNLVQFFCAESTEVCNWNYAIAAASRCQDLIIYCSRAENELFEIGVRIQKNSEFWRRRLLSQMTVYERAKYRCILSDWVAVEQIKELRLTHSLRNVGYCATLTVVFVPPASPAVPSYYDWTLSRYEAGDFAGDRSGKLNQVVMTEIRSRATFRICNRHGW